MHSLESMYIPSIHNRQFPLASGAKGREQEAQRLALAQLVHRLAVSQYTHVDSSDPRAGNMPGGQKASQVPDGVL